MLVCLWLNQWGRWCSKSVFDRMGTSLGMWFVVYGRNNRFPFRWKRLRKSEHTVIFNVWKIHQSIIILCLSKVCDLRRYNVMAPLTGWAHAKNDPWKMSWSIPICKNRRSRWPAAFITITSTHWGRDKMAAVFQTTFSNAFSWMKVYKFRLSFHWRLFLRVPLTTFHHWFR